MKTTIMSRDLKGLMRFALENSDGTSESKLDPERAKWLQEALSNYSVDLTQQLKLDLNMLARLLDTPDPDISDMKTVLQDIISLTEDVDLAKDFFKLGGTSLIHDLLEKAPLSLRPDVYELLASVSQNHQEIQQICLESHYLQDLLRFLPDEKNPDHLKKLLLAISCLARGYPPSVAEFQSANGFEAVLEVLSDLLANGIEPDEAVERVLAKGAFLVYSLLQEVLPFHNDGEENKLPSKILRIVMRLPNIQEHLLASLVLLFTNSSSIEEAIDVENIPANSSRRAREILTRDETSSFVKWLQEKDSKIDCKSDPAFAEVRTYIGTLLHLLGRQT